MARPVPARLAIRDLDLSIGDASILQGVSFDVAAGEAVGLVGESGSGKSLTALSAIGLLPPGSRTSGSIRLDGEELLSLSEHGWQDLRGDRIGFVFQEPMTALNPMHRAVDQVAETVLLHRDMPREQAREIAIAQFGRVGLSAGLAERYPHQLSGGQRQRVVIAIATVLGPDLVIADEPTTALDVVRQREVLDLLRSLVHEDGTSLVLISHDLAVVAETAEHVVVMRGGRVVDRSRTVDLLRDERPDYTRQLVAATTSAVRPVPAPIDAAPVLELRNVSRHYGGGFLGGPPLLAVDDVSLAVPRGGAVGLVGGSGCGKSTLARVALMLDRPATGSVLLDGTPIETLSDRALLPYRRMMQIVFQDPGGSFDPQRTVGWSIAEPLHMLRDLTPKDRRTRVAEAIERVRLSPADAGRYPHEFSGGQRQRLAIARAIVAGPKLIVADEAVSALDVSVRGHVLELLATLREELGIALLFISHDLGVVRAVTTEVAVMDAGRIVEHGATERVLGHPEHPVTRSLLDAMPNLERAVAARQASIHPSTGTA